MSNCISLLTDAEYLTWPLQHCRIMLQYKYKLDQIAMQIHIYDWSLCRGVSTYFTSMSRVLDPSIVTDTSIGIGASPFNMGDGHITDSCFNSGSFFLHRNSSAQEVHSQAVHLTESLLALNCNPSQKRERKRKRKEKTN